MPTRTHGSRRLLAAANAPAAAQAPHIERSAEHGDENAIAVLVEAATASSRRAPALAARWYAAALRLLPETPDTEGRRIELLLAMANSLLGAGLIEPSRDTLCEVLERMPAEHPARLAIVAGCARVEHLLGRHGDAHSRLSLAYRAAPDKRSLRAVFLQIELAAGAAYECRMEDMLAWAEQAVDGATRRGQRAILAMATGQLAMAQYYNGLPAFDTMDRAAALMDPLDDAELGGRPDIGMWVASAESALERHERAVEHGQRVIDVTRATGQGAALLVTMTGQAWSLMQLGRLDEARATLSAAIEAGYLSPHFWHTVAVGFSSLLATYRGDFAAAVTAGEESVRLARAANSVPVSGISSWCLATPLIEMGEARRARECILAASSGGERRSSRFGDTTAYEILTRAELELGRIDAAQEWAHKAEAASHAGLLGIETAFARRATAAVALARGGAAEAARVALDGAVRADGARAPVEAGRCRILAAKALVQAGRRGDAIAELGQAAEQLGRVGAHGYHAQAQDALTRLGGRASRRASSARQDHGLRSLTERQREVAELVRRGHTNRDIATALFISEKTVERHLARIFAQLGVSRRTEVALRIAAAGEG